MFDTVRENRVQCCVNKENENKVLHLMNHLHVSCFLSWVIRHPGIRCYFSSNRFYNKEMI